MFYITSTPTMANALRRSIGQLQSELVRGQKELSTGIVSDLGEALGVETGRDYALAVNREDIQAVTATNKLVGARLDSTLTALSSLASDAKALRATLILARTDRGNPAAIETQARHALGAFISTLNGSDGASHIFGGINADGPPIGDYFATPASANKQALDAAFLGAFGMSQSSGGLASIGESDMRAFLSGSMADLFSTANWTADWSKASDQPLQSRISMSLTIESSVTANDPALRKLAMGYTMLSDLGLQELSGPAYDAVLATATEYIDGAISGLTQTQALAGVMQNSVRSANQTMSIQQVFFESQIRTLEYVDAAEAATRVNSLMTQIEAAYTLTSRLNRLTLSNYL